MRGLQCRTLHSAERNFGPRPCRSQNSLLVGPYTCHDTIAGTYKSRPTPRVALLCLHGAFRVSVDTGQPAAYVAGVDVPPAGRPHPWRSQNTLQARGARFSQQQQLCTNLARRLLGIEQFSRCQAAELDQQAAALLRGGDGCGEPRGVASVRDHLDRRPAAALVAARARLPALSMARAAAEGSTILT